MSPPSKARMQFHWEGNVFHYSGEGQVGDQKLIQGNRAVLNHASDGRSLRLFEGAGGVVTYSGEFILDEPPYYWASRPGLDGIGRSVIMFRLIPKGSYAVSGTEYSKESKPEASLDSTYREANEDPKSDGRQPFEVDPDLVDRGLSAHAQIQNAIADFARKRGLHPVSPGLGDPNFDVGWWENDVFAVVEVKSLTDNNEIGQLRLGLGQLLDYADMVRRKGHAVRPILAIERVPSDSRWIDICEHHGVELTWPELFSQLV